MRKNLWTVIVLTCLALSILLCTVVSSEDDVLGAASFEWQSGVFTQSENPRFSSDVGFFSLGTSDKQKAEKLRDFLLERLNNLNAYRNELSIGEYFFPNESTASVVLFFDLTKLSGVSLYYNSANKATTQEILLSAMNDVRDKDPKAFWCKSQWVWYWNSSYKLTKFGIKLDCREDLDVNGGMQLLINKVNALTAEFDGYVQKITDLIPENYSDYQKILFVNDYLCTNYRYDIRYYSNPDSAIYNVYDFFKEDKGVCQAYALAFMAIMDELGIRCDSVVSEAINHIWNLVELNEKWYHIDVTWNDPEFATLDYDTFGKATHSYFLLSSDALLEKRPSGVFDIDGYGYEIGTEYDEPIVNLDKTLRSAFVELDGTWYTTGYNEDTLSCGLCALDSPDISLITYDDLETHVYDIGLWTIEGENTFYPYSYSYLVKYGDLILFNSPTAICVFDGNGVTELYVPEKAAAERIYGFTVKDGMVYVQLATNPNSSGMENATVITVKILDLIKGKLAVRGYDKTTMKATVYTPIATEAILIFVSYDEYGRVLDCKIKECLENSVIANGENEYAAPDGFDTRGAEKIKIMVWENIAALSPMCKAFVQ